MAAADISQEEWDRHRGEVLRTSGIVSNLSNELARTNKHLDLVRIEMRRLSVRLNEWHIGMVERLDKHSDWRETTGQIDRAKLEKELERYRRSEERRIATWVKVAIGIAVAIAEAGIVHFLKW